MHHLRVPVFLLAALVLLRCIAAAPSHSPVLPQWSGSTCKLCDLPMYFNPGSSDDDEQENALPDKESRSLPELISGPFLGLTGTNSRDLQKRGCNLASCTTQRLADALGRTGKGTTDVGPNSFGKRDIHQPPGYLPF